MTAPLTAQQALVGLYLVNDYRRASVNQPASADWFARHGVLIGPATHDAPDRVAPRPQLHLRCVPLARWARTPRATTSRERIRWIVGWR